ncbi:unnamed protein product [Effrenium voratum]|nr:unnamed protein product [Effrenium voratum]
MKAFYVSAFCWALALAQLEEISEVPSETCETGECDDGQLSMVQMRARQTESESEFESGTSEGVPMIAYPKKYCSHCGEMAFCHHASNPGCGGMAKYGVASFDNKARSHGCGPLDPSLTVPRSYVKDLNVLRKLPGAHYTLRDMLVSGLRHYRLKGGQGPVWQCIHAPSHVSVRWLHLHTFCEYGKVDNLPSRKDYCAVMSTETDAERIAAAWVG